MKLSKLISYLRNMCQSCQGITIFDIKASITTYHGSWPRNGLYAWRWVCGKWLNKEHALNISKFKVGKKMKNVSRPMDKSLG